MTDFCEKTKLLNRSNLTSWQILSNFGILALFLKILISGKPKWLEQSIF